MIIPKMIHKNNITIGSLYVPIYSGNDWEIYYVKITPSKVLYKNNESIQVLSVSEKMWENRDWITP